MTKGKWKKMDRDLKKGDIIRTKISNKKQPRYGEYIYAVCTGSGFGCRMDTAASAIYVEHESFNLEEVLENRGKDTIYSKDWNRWERFWGIAITQGNGGLCE